MEGYVKHIYAEYSVCISINMDYIYIYVCVYTYTKLHTYCIHLVGEEVKKGIVKKVRDWSEKNRKSK